MSASYHSLKEYRNSMRLWLQNMSLAKANFTKGRYYRRFFDFNTGEIILSLLPEDYSPDKKNPDKTIKIVSGRNTNGKITPIIDILHSDLVKISDGFSRVRVDYFDGKLVISIHHIVKKQKERVERLKENLANGIIEEGTVCAGLGMTTLGIKDGLGKQGIKAKTRWILDRERKFLDTAAANNPACKDAEIFEASLEEIEPHLLCPVDVFQFSLSCRGHSQAGKSKTGNAFAELHPEDATGVVGLIRILEQVNASVLISENVKQARNSASYTLIRAYLETLGYTIHEADLGQDQSGNFEARERYWMIAVDSSLHQPDFKNIPHYAQKYDCFGDIMDVVADDDTRWRTNQGLKDKAVRDKAAGKGFGRNLLDENSTSCGTIRKLYNKMGSCDDSVLRDDGMERPMTLNEHARVKGAPTCLTDGNSNTEGHEGLGQGAVMGHPTGCGELVGMDVFIPYMESIGLGAKVAELSPDA